MIIVAHRVRWIFVLVLKILALLILAVVILSAAAVGYSAFRREQPVTLPAPTGPFAVGRMTRDWIDTSRPDPLNPAAGTDRELLVWIWYPTDSPTSASAAPYLPADWAQTIDADLGIGRFLRQDLATVQGHALADPPLATQRAHYPVVIFEPGYGDLPANYSTILENLASHGYVVVGIGPTDLAPVVFPDGRVVLRSPAGTIPDNAPPAVMEPLTENLVNVLSSDARFVLDQLQTANVGTLGQLAGRLDLTHVAFVGHSLGGATAIEVCRTDARCTAAIDIDGTPIGMSTTSGISRPLFVLQHPMSNDDDNFQKMSAVVADSTGPRLQLVLQGAQHLNFSDDAVLFEPLLGPLGVLGSIDGARGLAVTNAYLVAFLDQYLRGTPAPLLNGPSPSYPEVTFLSS